MLYCFATELANAVCHRCVMPQSSSLCFSIRIVVVYGGRLSVRKFRSCNSLAILPVGSTYQLSASRPCQLTALTTACTAGVFASIRIYLLVHAQTLRSFTYGLFEDLTKMIVTNKRSHETKFTNYATTPSSDELQYLNKLLSQLTLIVQVSRDHIPRFCVSV
jgi:hypothetical protein